MPCTDPGQFIFVCLCSRERSKVRVSVIHFSEQVIHITEDLKPTDLQISVQYCANVSGRVEDMTLDVRLNM